MSSFFIQKLKSVQFWANKKNEGWWFKEIEIIKRKVILVILVLE